MSSNNRVKEEFTEVGLKRLEGDEDYYYKHNDDGELEGMVSTHMDDFNLVGTNRFVTLLTDKFGKALDISKIEDK